MNSFLEYVIVVVLSYLLGSLNFGIIVSKYIKHDDIRNHGSGNAGITNYARTFGGKSTLLVMLGDMGKCALAVLVARYLMGDLAKFLAGFFVMLGHSFPIFFGFRGGKGVLSAATGICCLSPVVFLVLIALFLLMVLTTKYVSVGSITAAFFYPLMLSAFFGAVPFFMLSTALLTAGLA